MSVYILTKISELFLWYKLLRKLLEFYDVVFETWTEKKRIRPSHGDIINSMTMYMVYITDQMFGSPQNSYLGPLTPM